MCDKRLYDSETQARNSSKAIARARGGKKQRAYYCEECRGYHLTTKKPKHSRGGGG